LQYLADDVQLVVSELATNALTHALRPHPVHGHPRGRRTVAAGESTRRVAVPPGHRCWHS
jgi:anti-sigma regulatory factor (Ser/Thr protein kinase)